MSNQQGKDFKYNKNKYKLKIKNNMCEGYENISNVGGNSVEASVQKMKDLENKYNDTLLKYKNSYSKMLRHKTVKDVDISHLPYRKSGAVASYAGENYYITDRYVMKKIPKEGDMRENWECPEPSINITENQKQKLTMGIPLRRKKGENETIIYQTCNDTNINNGGVQVQDEITKNRAWLNDLGELQQFKDPSAPPKACKSVVHTIPSIKYEMMKKGKKLGPTDTCYLETFSGMEGFRGITEGNSNMGIMGGGTHSPQSVTDSAETATEKHNDELKDVLYEMQDETIKLKDVINVDNNLINDNAKKIESDINKLDEQKKLIQTLKNEITSLDGNIRDANYLVESTNMKYVAWGISLTTIILLILFLKK